MSKLRLTPQTTRLSETLQPFRSRKLCQSCGGTEEVYGWIECDHNDHREPIYVFLCERCGKKLISPHPRLYHQMSPHEPCPGVMDICIDCTWRVRSRCTNPMAVFNGGAQPGLKIDAPNGGNAHIYLGGGKGYWQTIWLGPAKSCSGKEIAKPGAGQKAVVN